jgi:hypothetical protein
LSTLVIILSCLMAPFSEETSAAGSAAVTLISSVPLPDAYSTLLRL